MNTSNTISTKKSTEEKSEEFLSVLETWRIKKEDEKKTPSTERTKASHNIALEPTIKLFESGGLQENRATNQGPDRELDSATKAAISQKIKAFDMDYFADGKP